MTPRCEDCVYWFGNPDSSWRYCRRNPPTVHYNQIWDNGKYVPETGHSWPATYRTDWCGEFKPREKDGNRDSDVS